MGTEALVELLESYRGRDRLIRTLCYGCQLVGGVLVQTTDRRQEYGNSFLAMSSQLSHCRVVLRLFDDLSMFAYSKQYGLGKMERDSVVRWLSVLSNMVDQLYYPCEHMAWAADANVIHTKSDNWWTFSTGLWGLSLLLGVLRSLWVLYVLQRKGKRKQETRDYSQVSLKELNIVETNEVLSVISNVADLSNAIHWMPPGFLWGGCFPPWLVGLMGTISSLIGLYKTTLGSNSGSL